MKHKFKNKIIIIAVLAGATLSCGNQKPEESSPIQEELFFGELNPNAPAETIQFGQLVGEWNVISFDSIPNEGWHESKATWIYRYILDGYAVEDIWREKFSDYTNNTKNIGRDFTGINIRIFDPTAKIWNITWIENGKNTMINNITAKMNDKGDIVMGSGQTSEVTFYDITEDSFEWKFEVLKDDKRILYSKMSASRLK